MGENRTMWHHSILAYWAGCRVGRDASDGRWGSKGPTRECPRFRLGIPEQLSCFGGGRRRPVFGQKIGGPPGKGEQGRWVGGWVFIILFIVIIKKTGLNARTKASNFWRSYRRTFSVQGFWKIRRLPPGIQPGSITYTYAYKFLYFIIIKYLNYTNWNLKRWYQKMSKIFPRARFPCKNWFF